jgi:hypothetical protein
MKSLTSTGVTVKLFGKRSFRLAFASAALHCSHMSTGAHLATVFPLGEYIPPKASMA